MIRKLFGITLCVVCVDHFIQVQLLSSLVSIGYLYGAMAMISVLSFLYFQRLVEDILGI